MRRLAAAWLVLALLAGPAAAFLPVPQSRGDAKRYGFATLRRHGAHVAVDASSSTIAGYNRWRPRGIGLAAAAMGRRPGARPIRESAEDFLKAQGPALGIDPASLAFERVSDGGSHKHALFRQLYHGIPVDFARVKVHLAPDGAVTGVDSDFDQTLSLDPTPKLAPQAAEGAALADAGGGLAQEPELVVFLDPARLNPARLAWKVRVRRTDALWRYYVDASTGRVLFRYNDFREFSSCALTGTVKGYVYDVDPSSTPAIQLRDFPHERVFVGDGAHWAETQPDLDPLGVGHAQGKGFYCSGTSIGKIFTQLQGVHVNVANFLGPSAHYDNGSGVWQTVGTPVSSPHPYANNAVVTSTIDLSGGIAPGAVAFLPVFTQLNVGTVAGGGFGESSDITDDDQLQFIDQFGNTVASYVGNFRAPFNATAVPGQLLRLRLKSNASGQGIGYDVSQSSYLTLSQQYVNGTNNDVIWTSSQTSTGLRSEISLFYHLNQMHDYFESLMTNDPTYPNYVAPSSAAYLPASGVNAMAFAGPNLINAFYDPDYDDLFFGDVSNQAPQDTFTDDATVPHHEYTHYVVEKIWPIQNFGQAGAISEANADYFSASSFEWSVGSPDSSIGRYTNLQVGGTGPLRELDCPSKAPCAVLTNSAWHGEIHDDSIFVSQAYWDIRKARETLQGSPAGANCVDRLIFNALLYFPESFQELSSALLRVDASGAVRDYCGGAGSLQGTILSAFSNHGLLLPGGTNDPYDVTVGITQVKHNDGFETAVDVSSTPSLSATIYPTADVDFYTFGAGPGLVRVKMALPPSTNNPGFYKGYMITLFDASHRQVAQAMPPYDGINTDSGFCMPTDCNTTSKSVELDYDNTTGQQLFVEISGGPTLSGGSTSGVNDPNQYTLTFSYPMSSALAGSIVSAAVDRDLISFNVHVTTFPQQQDYRFSYAQLRDHDEVVIPNTQTSSLLSPSGYLTLVSSQNAGGVISGTVRLQNGFAAAHPSLGTVYLEVFGYNVAGGQDPNDFNAFGSTVSLGLSNVMSLTTNLSDAKAYNNVFNPARGEHATIRWDVQSAGHLRMRLYTLNGTFIETLMDQDVSAGKGAVDWLGRNFAGSNVASGIYLLRIEGPGVDKTIKVAVVK